jgi:hypothetical protein
VVLAEKRLGTHIVSRCGKKARCKAVFVRNSAEFDKTRLRCYTGRKDAV